MYIDLGKIYYAYTQVVDKLGSFIMLKLR